ncbi:MAG: tetratricopeptide repeat protein [Proteobacteria bacterium]|nr:tetratricopeptide repeat protein [Pseudomonadota bacterium]MBU1640309.1 tetratricopeptide repeat protein [Pseudomonadota bacterium]
MKYLFVIFVLLGAFVSPLSKQARAVTIDELTQAIATAPAERLHSYYVYRSRAYLAMGDEGNGLADLGASLRVRPTEEAYLLRGEYFHKTNRLDAAINDYTAALRVNNDCVKAYRLRSAAYYDNKDYVQAIIDASSVKLYDDDDPFALSMIEKCYVQTSPRERIVIESDVASVMRTRQALLNSGGGGTRSRSRPSPSGNKVAEASTKKKKCGPRRKT